MFNRYVYLIQSDETKYDGVKLTLSFAVNTDELLEFQGHVFVVTAVKHRFTKDGDYRNTILVIDRI